MDKRAKVGLFGEIRLEYEHGVGTFPGVAEKFGVALRLARYALDNVMSLDKKRVGAS